MKYKKHNLRYHRIYSVWCNMKTRCYNPQPNHHHYKEKGIIICKEWVNDVQAFFDWSMDNGYADNLSIDRIDTDGSYSPTNCRWTTKTQQARNRCLSHGRKYKGTKLDKRTNKYEARIVVNKKHIYLGTHINEVDAAKAYNEYVIDNNTGHSLNLI